MAVAKKTPGKKTPTKRVYTRKPKVQVETEANVDAVTTAEPEQEETSVKLTEVAFLNLTGVPYFFKAQVLHLLEAENYIWAETTKPILHDPMVLHVDLLRFNHVNKLVYSVHPSELSGEEILTTVKGDVHLDLFFTQEPVMPNMLNIGNAVYARIS